MNDDYWSEEVDNGPAFLWVLVLSVVAACVFLVSRR